MKDISLCSGVGCKIKHQCKRYILGLQVEGISWWVEPAYKNGKCDNLIK